MYDVELEWGSDLSASSSGDLALVNGRAQINQRVLRRLLTNQGDYIWSLDYGGGLGLFIGSTTQLTDIEAVIRAQIALEPAVPINPAPSINVHAIDSVHGYVVADVTYADPSSGDLVNLNVTVG